MTILSSYAAAHEIGVSPNTLKRWRCLGKGPRYIKLGNAKQSGVVYDAADIEEWKSNRKFASTSAATVTLRLVAEHG